MTSQVSPTSSSSLSSSLSSGISSTATTTTAAATATAAATVATQNLTTVANSSMEDMNDHAPNGPDPNRWFFDKERLENTPSRKCGIDPDKELMLRQQSANFIQDVGQRLHVNQLCINTAIVYMHRFYMYHSFSHFHQNHVSTAAIFLAAKVEEQPRKLEHVIKVAHYCLNREAQPIDTKTEAYAEQAQELVMTENILLQTLGFDVAIDHPHAHVVKCCQLVRASKDLAQTSYFMATNSLHLTTMCLQYKPTVVACVCIHLTCKWSNWEIPRSKEGRDWFWYVDDTVTIDQLEKLTTEFLAIFDKSPSRLKKKILSLNQSGSGGSSLSLSAYPTLMDPKSPGNPTPPSRSSPATSTHPGSNQLKRSSASMKPSSSQIASKQAKVNGGIGHHSVKPPSAPHGSSSQVPPSNSSSSSSKHPHYSSSSSGKALLPPHHGAKDAHMQPPSSHGKPPVPPGHHHSSSSLGHPPNYPHGSSSSSSSSSRSSSSHSHPMHQSSGGQPSKSSSSHNLPGQQHPSKPPHPQPSKVPYNYNVKSQIPSSSSTQQPPQAKPLGSSSSNSQQPPPTTNKPHFQPPPYGQMKKPYPDPSRRETPVTADFNGKRENSDDGNRRSSSLTSQSLSSSRSRPDQQKPGDAYSGSNLPPVSLPFNSSSEPPSRAWTDSTTSNTSSNSNNITVGIEPPRIPPGRTSLFSPDPDLMETNSFVSSTLHQSALKPELSPIGDLISVGAKGISVVNSSSSSNNNNHDGDSSINNSAMDNYFPPPPPSTAQPPSSSVSSSLFPNLFELGSTSTGGSGARSNMDSSSLPAHFDIKPEVSLGSETIHSAGEFSSTTLPLVPPASSSLAPSSASLLQNSKSEMESRDNSHHHHYHHHHHATANEDEAAAGGLHKKVKKNKKEKHKHKDKDRHDERKERKDKDEKKHKDKKDKDKSREDKKHKEKHKKEKHKEKDRDKSSSKSLSSSKYPEDVSSYGNLGMGEGAGGGGGNKLKINLGSRMLENPVMSMGVGGGGGGKSLAASSSSNSSKSSSKHSSKKHKGPDSQQPTPTTGIKLKIVPPRPPTLDDSRL